MISGGILLPEKRSTSVPSSKMVTNSFLNYHIINLNNAGMFPIFLI